jgi:hypothetical protein
MGAFSSEVNSICSASAASNSIVSAAHSTAGGENVTNPALAALLMASLSLTAARLDISGRWVMDKDRSFSNPAGLDQTMTIVQSGDEVRVEALQRTPQGERSIAETWTIDGKEREFVPVGTPGAKGKRVASWLPGNRGIIVRDETVTQGAGGPVNQVVTRKYTLSQDGQTLTVDYYSDSPRGSFESKRVFTRQ